MRGEPNLQSAAFDSQILTKFNDWCSQRQVIYPSSMANGQQPVIAAKFHSLLELPKLQRWFRDSPNPSRRKLLSHLHILNSSNYRRHNPKLTYQQICNYFANARAMQRKTVGQDSHNSLAVAAGNNYLINCASLLHEYSID